MRSRSVDQSSTYSIQVDRIWEFDRDGQHFRFEPGTYRVPTQCPRTIAEFALTRGIARKVLPILETKQVEFVVSPRRTRKVANARTVD